MTEFKSFYKKAGGEEGTRCLYPDRLDLYGCGCAHDCAYCYAKSLLDFRGMWDSESPSVAKPSDVSKTIAKLKRGSVVRLGGMTDCFQPVESRLHRTKQAIEALNKRGVHYLIVTKSPLVASDEYLQIMDKRLAHVQVSISCTDEQLAKRIENCESPENRMRAAEALSADGFDVSLRISPYLHEHVDMSALSRCDVPKALVEFLRVNHWIEKWLPIDTSEYTHKEGGYRHLPLKRKLELLKPLKECFDEVSVCEDVDGHYQRFKYFFNANEKDCCNLRKE